MQRASVDWGNLWPSGRVRRLSSVPLPCRPVLWFQVPLFLSSSCRECVGCRPPMPAHTRPTHRARQYKVVAWPCAAITSLMWLLHHCCPYYSEHCPFHSSCWVFAVVGPQLWLDSHGCVIIIRNDFLFVRVNSAADRSNWWALGPLLLRHCGLRPLSNRARHNRPS